MIEIDTLLKGQLRNDLYLKNLHDAANHGRQVEDYICTENEHNIRFLRHTTAKSLASELQCQFSPSLQEGMELDAFRREGNVIKIIEIDSNRADQVAKKFTSRLALILDIHKAFPKMCFEYAAFCYKGSDKNGHSELLEYFKMMRLVCEHVLPDHMKVFCYSFPKNNFEIASYGLRNED